jgi:AbrB family looped-hinge helix DNA binding protein
MTTKGQITIPKEVREQPRLAPGDRVDFVFDDRGAVFLRPTGGSVRELYGLLRRREGEASTVERMDQEIAEVVAEDQQRIRPEGPRR